MKVELDLQKIKRKYETITDFCLGKEYYENSEQKFFSLIEKTVQENLVKRLRFQKNSSLALECISGRLWNCCCWIFASYNVETVFWNESINISVHIKQVKSRSLGTNWEVLLRLGTNIQILFFPILQITVYKPKKEHIPSLTVDILIHTIVRPPSNFWHKENLCRGKALTISQKW